MFDLVLFDLDGTLVDTAPDIADAVNDTLAGRALPGVKESWVRDRIGFGTRGLLEQAYAAAARVPRQVAAQPAIIDELLDEFAECHVQRCGRRGHLYPDAASVLSTLRSAGVKLGLLTNKEQRFVRFLLEVHGLDGEFDVQVCGDSLPAKKPDPLPVRHCLEVLGMPPEKTLLVGDSATDVQTARNAGIKVWAVNYGYNQGKPIGQSHPDRVIGLIAEVLGPFAGRIEAAAGRAKAYAPRASSSSLYFRSNPRNW